MVGILTFDADKLSDAISTAFQDAKAPVAIRDLASLFGVLAAQQEALLALYTLTMKAKPDLAFTDQAVDVDKAISRAADMFGDALTVLAATYLPEEAADE